MRILVVDDEPDFLTTCRRLLALMGHEAVTATNGADALDHIDRGELDLVITDLRMGALGGQVVVRHARRAVPPVPVIIVTGHPAPGTDEFAREAQAILLVKPVGAAELKAAITRVLSG
jgi:CheY-like chemotaxis protein